MDSFLSGLLGRFHPRKTSEEMLENEEDRILARRMRRKLEEEQELAELQDFLDRKPYARDKARPVGFDEYVGQKTAKTMVLISLRATKLKKEPFPHSIFWAEPGLGKTTLAFLIAQSLETNLIITSGGQLETKEELLNIFRQFKGNDILFIDEIHAIPRKIAEMLYSAMEDWRFDYTTKANQVVNLNLPPFTLLGATTDLAKLLIPIRQRFQNRFHLVPYSDDELVSILRNYLTRIKYYPTVDAALMELAKRSRNVARYAVNYIKSLIDYAMAEHKILNVATVCEYFDKEGIDSVGLTRYDRQYLELLLHAPNFKAGLNTIVKSIGIDRRTVEQEIEPFLLRKKFIEVSRGGRGLLGEGFDYIT